jgi:hypothetical protein
MSNREVMRQALEALKNSHPYSNSDRDLDKHSEAITALRTALEQPEQEPYPEGNVVGPCICGSWPGGKCLKCPCITPPAAQRPWVGLTASTILNLMPSSIPAEHDGALMEFARDIEAKLKEGT